MNKYETQSNSNVSPDAYNSPSWWYDIRGFFILKFAYRDSLWRQVRFFAKNISENHLEAAIGTGSLCLMFLIFRKIFVRTKLLRFVGVDYAPEMLKGSKRIIRGSNIKLELEDLTKMKFFDNSFQSVNLPNSFHTIKDIEPAISEIHRVLQQNGTFCMNVLLTPEPMNFFNGLSFKINKWGQKRGILNRAYDKEEVIHILEKFNFTIKSLFRHNNSLYVTCIKA